jgi:hypothetical protein
MTILTQKNVAILFACQVGWGIYVSSGILPHAHWVDAVTVSFNAATAFLACLGFNRTPSGNLLSPEVISQVDRQAVVARAGDAVVQAAAAAVVADAQAVTKESQK